MAKFSYTATYVCKNADGDEFTVDKEGEIEGSLGFMQNACRQIEINLYYEAHDTYSSGIHKPMKEFRVTRLSCCEVME